MMMKSKIQRALTAAALGAVAAPVMVSIGCDRAEESGSTEVLRTYEGQTEVVTVQTPAGELQTVLLDAEGEERGHVTRDLDGNRTGTLGGGEVPAQVWNAIGDELQPVHDLLHTVGQSLTEPNEGATTPEHPDSNASFVPDTNPAASVSIRCRDRGYSNGRWHGTAVSGGPQYTAAQCASWAGSCGGNARVDGFQSIPFIGGQYPPAAWWTICYFSTT